MISTLHHLSFVPQRSMLRRHARALTVSVTSQALSSLTNFAIVLYVVRSMDKLHFGLYSLGFASMLLIGGLIVSSIAVPLVVNLPDQPHETRADYALHHAVAVVLVGLVIIALGVFARLAPALAPIVSRAVAVIATPVAVAVALYALRDLLVRVAYSERRESIVLASTLAVAVGVIVAFAGMWVADCTLSADYALFAYAAGQAAGCIIAFAMLRLPITHLHWLGVRQAFRDAWRGGRWNALSGVAYNLRIHAHNFVVAPVLGVTALADVNAARVFVTPASMAIPPFMQIFMPRLAEERSRGLSVLSRTAFLTVAPLACFALLYALVLMLSLPWVLPLALGDDYLHVGGLVLAWCVVTFLLVLRNGLTMVLEVNRAYRDVLLANTVAAVLAVLLALMLTSAFGPAGAVTALAAAETVLCVVLMLLLRARMVNQPAMVSSNPNLS